MPKAIQLDSILTFAESCYVAVAVICYKHYYKLLQTLLWYFCALVV